MVRYVLLRVLIITTIWGLFSCYSQPIKTLSVLQKEPEQINQQDILELSQRACQEWDQQRTKMPMDRPEYLRLQRLVSPFVSQINDVNLDYKIYLNITYNAWAMPSGCVGINSSLMRDFTDAEIQAVIAHEIGHIALNHHLKTFQKAKIIEAKNSASSVTAVVNKQLLQQQELEADNYAIALLKSKHLPLQGMLTMFDKFEETKEDTTSSHPVFKMRIDNINRQIAK